MSFGLLFTYAMTYGGSAVAIVNPFLGLLIYVCFAILRPGPGLWYWSVPAGNYSRILAISLLIGWALRGFGDWRLGRAAPVMVGLIGYLVWNALSAAQATVPSHAWDWVEGQAKVIVPCVVALTLIDSFDKVRQLTWVVLFSHGYVAYDLNMSYFAGFNRLHMIGFGGMDNNCNALGFVSVVGLGIVTALRAPQWWVRALAGASVAFLVHAVLFSFSRGAMLGLILVIGTAFAIVPKRPVHYLLLVVGLAAVAATTGPQVVERFGSSFKDNRDESADSRLHMWGICVREAVSHPLLGLGPHHFPIHARSFGLTDGKEAHTTWLQLAAEVGLVGVGFLLVYYVVPVVALWPLTRESHPVSDPRVRDTARMVVASTIGFLWTAQFVTLPGLEAPYFVALIGAGVLKVESAAAPPAEVVTP